MTRHATQILIVEDDHSLREALLDTASFAGLDATGAADGTAALELLAEEHFDLVISDIQMEPMDGHTLLREIRSRYRDLPVVLMTAYESIQSAVSALREGATDYLVKPFEAEVLVARIGDWLPPAPAPLEDDVVAVDPVSRRVFELARRVAQSDASVMITGESGVGKEIVFRTIHRHSQRATQAPVAINCAAIPDNMLEAVLFGYDKGAFTGAYKASPGKFEQAQDSTLLLDEISEMPLALQAKLLRVLQERQVERLGSNKVIDLDVRIVATTNRDLRREVEAGRFREDLYYRLNVMPINVPPLRQRREDIVPLAKALLARAAARSQQAVPAINGAACERLMAHHWPGNIRELDNVMQRALILHQGEGINLDDLVFEQMTPAVSSTLGAGVSVSEAPRAVSFADEDDDDDDACGADSLGGDLKDHERRLILNALEEGRGSRKFAAERLGISPRTLRYKLARLRDAGVAVPGV
ncbi:MAG: sigma-54-dependent Fis family transcriptional regulator [Proteobacteria bacterium]|nr:sigma-54-dependent Fis family transcriptional regulator [Pseudomonadota bacterium]